MADQQPPPGAPSPGAAPVPAPQAGAGWGGVPAHPATPTPIHPAYGRPLHQPGTVPLRPLTVSDFFDAAFRTVRRNPTATVGMAALVTTAFLAVPFLVTVALGALGRLGGSSADPYAGVTFGDVATGASGVLTSVLSGLAGVVVAGLVVPVVTRAAIGRRLTIAESWQRSRGRLLRLLGLTLLEALIALVVAGVAIGLVVAVGAGLGNLGLAIGLGVLLAVAVLCGLLAMHVKWFQLAAPVLVAERRGVLASLSRAGRLSSGNFWRVLGTWLLVTIASAFVAQLLTIPLAIVGAVAGVALPGSLGTAVLLVSTQLSSVLSGALVAPFTGTVAVLQYLDLRFRKEGFDIELIAYTEQLERAGDS